MGARLDDLQRVAASVAAQLPAIEKWAAANANPALADQLSRLAAEARAGRVPETEDDVRDLGVRADAAVARARTPEERAWIRQIVNAIVINILANRIDRALDKLPMLLQVLLLVLNAGASPESQPACTAASGARATSITRRSGPVASSRVARDRW